MTNLLKIYEIYYNELINIDNQNINLYVNFIQEQLFFSANKYFNDQEP